MCFCRPQAKEILTKESNVQEVRLPIMVLLSSTTADVRAAGCQLSDPGVKESMKI